MNIREYLLGLLVSLLLSVGIYAILWQENLDNRVTLEQTIPMGRLLDDILHDALELSADERALLAIAVQDSLHNPVDKDVEKAWATEIDRRIGQIDRGEVKLIAGDQVLAEARSRARR